MGLFGGSSSSSSVTKNYVDNSSINANQTGALLGIAGNANKVGTVNVLDAGAIKRALDSADRAVSAAVQSVNNTSSNALQFAANNDTRASKAVNNSMAFAERAANNAMRIAFEASQPATATINKQLIGFGLVVAGTVAALVFVKR